MSVPWVYRPVICFLVSAVTLLYRGPRDMCSKRCYSHNVALFVRRYLSIGKILVSFSLLRPSACATRSLLVSAISIRISSVKLIKWL